MNTFEKWVFFVNMFAETLCDSPIQRSDVVEAAMEVNTANLAVHDTTGPSIPHSAKEFVEWWLNPNQIKRPLWIVD